MHAQAFTCGHEHKTHIEINKDLMDACTCVHVYKTHIDVNEDLMDVVPSS